MLNELAAYNSIIRWVSIFRLILGLRKIGVQIRNSNLILVELSEKSPFGKLQKIRKSPKGYT